MSKIPIGMVSLIPDDIPNGDPAAILAADHNRIAMGLKQEEDPHIRAQLERAERFRTGTPLEGEDPPLVLIADPPPSYWDTSVLQQILQNAHGAFTEYREGCPNNGWTLVEHDHRRQDWLLLEYVTSTGEFRLKVEATINVPAHKIARACTDIDVRTRCQWDGGDMKPVHLVSPSSGVVEVLPAIRRRCEKIIRPYSNKSLQQAVERRKMIPMDRCFEIVESFVHPPAMAAALVAIRRIFAVQWAKYYPETREYILLSATLEDAAVDPEVFGCPSGCVDTTGFVGMHLQPHSDDPGRTVVTTVVAIDPNGWLPANLISWGKVHLLRRVELIESVCTSPRYERIYD